MKFAPVLIPTLNRFNHFKRCVNTLSKNKFAEDTELFIAMDYPLKESHWEGYKKIEEFIGKIEGFKKVNLIKRTRNLGAINNSALAKKEVFEKFDKLIVSEDDNEFSSNFLEYINKGLEKFEHDPNVYAICGYQFPINVDASIKGNYYLYRSLSAWGYGMWKNKLLPTYYTKQESIDFLKNRKLVLKSYQRNQVHFASFINTLLKDKECYGDRVIGLHMAKNANLKCVFPTISKVRNRGHDGTGINCKAEDNEFFKQQSIDVDLRFNYSELEYPKNKIENELKKYFKLSYPSRIKTWSIYCLLRIKYFFRF